MKPGDHIDRFELVDDLGSGGGGGAVYLARDPESGGMVALKTLRPEYLPNPSLLPRFLREAEVYRGLDHPGIIRLVRTGFSDGHHFMALEHVEGRTLGAALCQDGAFDLRRVRSVAEQLLAALEHAHARSVIHRDLKPTNVLLTPEDAVKVIDFGVAGAEDPYFRTTPGALLGTLRYASPEQIKGLAADARSDLYSIGVMLWELLTGRAAITGANLIEVVRQQQQETFGPPSATRLGLPPELDAWVLSLMAADPAHRPPDAAAAAAGIGAAFLA